MSIEIRTGIPGNDQESSFMNATLQGGPPGYEFSVAVHLDVPLIGVYDEETLAHWLRGKFSELASDPRVHVEIEIGPEGDGKDGED